MKFQEVLKKQIKIKIKFQKEKSINNLYKTI